MNTVRVEQHSITGGLWIAGWLFSIGYLGLPLVWKGLFAIVLWPYYIGQALNMLGY